MAPKCSGNEEKVEESAKNVCERTGKSLNQDKNQKKLPAPVVGGNQRGNSMNRRPPLFLLLVPAILTVNFGVARAQTRPIYLNDKAPIAARVNDLLSRLTLQEKVSLVHANGIFSVAGVPRLGIPELIMDDGPLGVRADVGDNFVPLGHTNDFATAMPATLGLAATWDTNLAQEFGTVIGQEAVQRGKDIMFGPAVNIVRTPLDGRNEEFMGEDPFLASRVAVNYIEGEQG